MFYKNGDIYEGKFEDGIPMDIHATVYYINNDEYYGEFKNDSRNGIETLSKPILGINNNQSYVDKCVWENDICKEKIKD